jgi:hypothetical protein
MPYNSIFHSNLKRGTYRPELAAFLEKLEKVIANTALPDRVKEDETLGKQTEKALGAELQKQFGNDIKWEAEKGGISQGRADRADFYAEIRIANIKYVCIIEADPTRGDAIAKKFVSRVASITDSPLIYVTLCYTGTQKGTTTESKKYMEYCCDIAARLSKSGHEVIYLGFMPR